MEKIILLQKEFDVVRQLDLHQSTFYKVNKELVHNSVSFDKTGIIFTDIDCESILFIGNGTLSLKGMEKFFYYLGAERDEKLKLIHFDSQWHTGLGFLLVKLKANLKVKMKNF